MKECRYRQRKPKSLFYRVSVLDEDKNRWIVRHAGKTADEAETIVAGYFESGIMARMSACI